MGSVRAGGARLFAKIGHRHRRACLQKRQRALRRKPRLPSPICRAFAPYEHPPVGPRIQATLPISGLDGTLERRLEDARVRGKIRAKTGTLNESAALSGYMRSATNREIAFSIIFNDPPTFAWRYRPVQDRLAADIEAFDD